MSADPSRHLQTRGPVLVTGGAGFIGSHLCRKLAGEGWEIHATSRHPQSNDGSSITWWQADLADASETSRIFRILKPSVVYHLAGSVGAGPGTELVLPTYHSLLTSAVNLLIAAQETGCGRIILAGSFTEPLPGAINPTPGSPYAAAKWASTGYGRMFHALYGAPVVNLRPFMTYGPAQNPAKLIPTVIASLLQGERPKLSSGQISADWVYISDIVDAFAAAASVPALEGATLDLGTGRLMSVRTVIEELMPIVGNGIEPIFGALPDRPAENEIAADTGPAADRLGWRATTPLAEGLSKTVEWYRSALR